MPPPKKLSRGHLVIVVTPTAVKQIGYVGVDIISHDGISGSHKKQAGSGTSLGYKGTTIHGGSVVFSLT